MGTYIDDTQDNNIIDLSSKVVNTLYNPTVYDKECPVCHEPFSTTHKNQICCSVKCASKKRKGKRHYKLICEVCRKVHSAGHTNAQTCSDKCRKILRERKRKQAEDDYII